MENVKKNFAACISGFDFHENYPIVGLPSQKCVGLRLNITFERMKIDKKGEWTTDMN